MRKGLFMVMLLCMGIATHAQFLLDDSLQAVLRPYRAKGIDTIITLTIPYCGHMLPDIDSLNGQGEIMIGERAWLFYKKNHQLISVKYVSGLGNFPDTGKYAISRELVCINPDPFNWIIQHESQVVADRILPNVIRYEHNNAVVYDERHDRYPRLFHIGIHINQKSYYFDISGDGLLKYFREGEPENLNYEYNNNSALNQALQHLLRYRDKYNKQYFFPAARSKNP